MAAWVGAWAAAWVVCLAAHAHAQLGVGGGDGAEDTPTTTTTTTTDRAMQGGQEEGRKEGREVPEVVTEDPWKWRPLAETYRGCYREERFNGTLMFVNLTEVMAVHQAGGEEEACFHLCRVKEPFSAYIAVSPAVGGGVDGCGCKDYLDPSDAVDDEGCDEVLRHYRAYCGPSNFECLNRAGQIDAASSILLSLPLVTLLLSRLSHRA